MVAKLAKLLAVPILAAILVMVWDQTGQVRAHAPSGAVFTTLEDGSEVNLNIFPSKEAVYLDGGPGPGAPQHAAGLDPGTYVFQVTDPSGKTLLSTDSARCRQFVVVADIIDSVVDNDCEHKTGNDIDHPPAKTVQLFPFKLTPNPGGVYKVWVTRVEDFLLGCQALGKAGNTGLNLVDCGPKTGGNAHGFIPSHSKTDNFKVKKAREGVEIDVRFFKDMDGDGHYPWDPSEPLIAGMQIVWNDTHGASNIKHSDPNYHYGTFAHVEAAEPGVHYIQIIGGPECNIGLVHVDGVDQGVGPQTVSLTVLSSEGPFDTHWIDVACVQ